MKPKVYALKVKTPYLYVALDNLTENEAAALQIAGLLADQDEEFGFKVNLDLVMRHGVVGAMNMMKPFGRPIFTDLKMWNGTRTMTTVIKDLVACEVAYFNVFAFADTQLPEAIEATRDTKTKVLGVTVLTHYNDAYCQRHFRRSLESTVRHLAITAQKSGCHGIILPGTTLDYVEDLQTIKAVPGIRLSWYKDTRHEEEIEPRATKERADIVICGSPITKSQNPVTALHAILAELS